MLTPLCLSVRQDLFKSPNQKHILAITRRHGSLDSEEETDGKVLKGHITTGSLDVSENWEFPNSHQLHKILYYSSCCQYGKRAQWNSQFITEDRLVTSLVSNLRMPPSERQSGEQSQISWAYSPKAVRTNEIVRSVIITYRTCFTTVLLKYPYLFWCKMF